MTIGGWIVFAFFTLVFVASGIWFANTCKTKLGKIFCIVVSIILIGALLGGELWYFNNTASGQRAVVDQRSNLSGGLMRTINVYTANGDIIATYYGNIDIEESEGGYIKFDFYGRRYIYYNCFVETIAELDGAATQTDLQPGSYVDLF